jgi:hypothetical protein
MDQVALFSMCLYCHMIYESQDSRTIYVKGIIFFRSMWKESLHINAYVFIYLSQWQEVFNFFIGSTKMLWLVVYITVNIDWKMVKSETVMSIFFLMKFLNIPYANIFGMSSHWNNLCGSVFLYTFRFKLWANSQDRWVGRLLGMSQTQVP